MLSNNENILSLIQFGCYTWLPIPAWEKSFTAQKISSSSRSKKKPSPYFIVTANRNSAAQLFTTKCGCCSVQLF